MAAQSCRHVCFICQAEQADGHVAKGRHDLGRRATSYLTPVFVKGDIADPMYTILHSPMTSPQGQHPIRIGL